jgi:hypothetical protein
MQAGVKAVLMRREVASYLTGVGAVLATAVLLAVSVVSTACVATTETPARAIIVTSLPPAPLAEERTPQPRPSTVWIAGYWHWTGIQYAWIPGHWEASPHVGASWRAPRYVKVESTYMYEPGSWWTGGGNGGPASTPPAPTDAVPNNASVSAFH